MRITLIGSTLILLVCGAAGPAGSASSHVRQRGPVWHIDNGILHVTLDTRRGEVSVRDRRCEYTWRGGDKAIEPTEIVAQRADAEPSVDGRVDDWPELPIALTCDMVADAREVDRAADLSARAGVMWTPDAFYLAAIVTDDTVVFPAADEAEWWFFDSVEFWLGAEQYALRPDATGGNIWSRRGNFPDAQVAIRKTADGYVAEARVPLGPAGRLGQKLGGRLPFAIGINDAEEPGDRQGQLYFPTTWRHSTPDTFALAVLGDAQGRKPSAPAAEPTARLRDVQPLKGDLLGVQFETDVRVQGGERLAALVQVGLPEDKSELVVTLDLPDKEADIGSMKVCSALALDDPNGIICVAAYYDGLGLPITQERWRGRQYASWSMDMPWIGLTDGKKGYLLLADTPDDALFRLELVETEAGDLLAPSGWAAPSKGALGYTRRFRYFFADDGGYVALCKWYREYARQLGLLKTLKEKQKVKPHVARLAGAPDIWGNCSLDFCRQAKAAGMDRLIVNGPSSAEDMEAIKQLGFLISKYDNYEDSMEGKNDHYGDVKWPEDCCILPNGEPMTAWLTFDKKTQFMKRCAALHEDVSRRWVPKDLEKYPYNARFIDVTTATGLRECYSEVHGLTRTEDKEAKRRLAKYIGDELGLVLGGEHGRWWGVDIYDYWEGMQSGGHYSWPAGHVGTNIPETREDIGQDYLDYGLGQQHRLPLWELVFGDCVVSTWYWGDSTGHLRQAAPELAAKKDAYNILYGTVPLYWVSRPYSYNWSDPELRARLLESYRNTCKLHEVIGFEEMVSHESVTPDKNVQRTKFADGTEVTVNFGAQPHAVQHGGKTYRLPEFGFLAQGPKVLQYKTVEAERSVTFIKTDGYLFCDAGGQMRDFGPVKTDGKVTLRIEEERLQVLPEGTQTALVLRPQQLVKGWSLPQTRALVLDEEGEPAFQTPPQVAGDALELPTDGGPLMLVTGRAAAKPDVSVVAFEISSDSRPPTAPRGEPVKVEFQLSNQGGVAAETTIALYADNVQPERKLAEQQASLPPGRQEKLAFSVDPAPLAGEHEFVAVADPEGELEELVEANNVARRAVYVEPDWARWAHHADMEVNVGACEREDWPVGLAINLGEAMPTGAKLSPSSVRVAELQGDKPGRLAPSQFEPTTPGSAEGEVWWTMPGRTPAGEVRRFRLFWNAAGDAELLPTAAQCWDEERQELSLASYRVGFFEGTIKELRLTHPGAPQESIVNMLLCSSGDTGWGQEANEGLEFEVLHSGPVRTVIETNKDLGKGYEYRKLYEFYPRHFIVNIEGAKPLIWSRGFYAVDGEYEDDKGNQATMDGKGEAEGISGQNAGPQWYTIRGPGWAHACIAMSEFDNMSYWDGGARGQIGFTSGSLEGHRVGYTLRPEQPDASFGAKDHELLTTPVVVKRR